MEHPEEIPVWVGIYPAVWFRYGKEMQYFIDQYPQFFKGYQCDIDSLRKDLPPSYRKGKYIDENG